MIEKLLARKEKGFSLVEVIIVLAIAGLIGFMIVNLFPSVRLVGSSKHEVIAKEIALKSIEDSRSKGYANLANGTTSIIDSRLSSLSDSTAELIVADCPENVCTNDENLKQITAKVTWNESGDTKVVQLDTFISEGGLQ